MAETDIVKLYMNATSSKRVNIIMKHYTDFMGVVDGYMNGLFYRIESEKESCRRRNIGELGVRVQNGGMHSDPTANKGNENIDLMAALIRCDFSGGIMDGVEDADMYMRSACLLNDMRKDYEHFNHQLSCLGRDEDIFRKYLCGQKTLADIADERSITYESAKQKIHRLRRKLKKQVIRFMDGKPEDTDDGKY